MSETKDTGDTKLRLSGAKPLSLKRSVETGRVRQSFSQGRSKPVVVEKKRKRGLSAVAEKVEVAVRPAVAPKPVAPPRQAVEPAPQPRGGRSGVVLRTLTEEEKDARAHALAESRLREAEERRRAVEESAQRATDQERLARERAEAETRQIEEEDRRRREEEARRRAEEEATRRAAGRPVEDAAAEAAEATRGRRRLAQPPRPARVRGQPERRRGKLTINKALDDSPRERSLASIRRRRERERRQAMGLEEPQAKIIRGIVVPEAITVQELANRMAERAVDVIKLLMKQGQMFKVTDVIDADTAQLVAEEMGHSVKRVSEADVEEGFIGEEDNPEDLRPRPPVVTVMGHVDHGKTSLLDALRESDVAAGEAGGITQHIGAYQVKLDSGQKVTFIDTPGHAAFTAMRARGARVTDVVVLVVAADDGVMPQTVEAINHAREAGVPIIVAINKIDRPNADPTRVRTDLLHHEIVVESMSGETLEVEVSALKRTNLDKLIDAILLQAEVQDLRANPDRSAEGVVIEAKLDRGRGPVATVLVQRGTLRLGDIVVLGSEWGRVRALVDDRGENVDTAGPSMPVAILGLNGTPDAGDQFAVVESESRAREITSYRQRKRRDLTVAGAGERATLEQMMSRLGASGLKELPILVKGDVQGSVGAITGALQSLSTEEVAARVVHGGVGGITESDVSLAATSGAVIFGFNVRANVQAREAATREHVDIRYYSVIYDLVDDIKAALSGMLAPTIRETFLGNAEILEVFHISKVGKVAGCRVTEGVVKRGAKVRLIRDSVVVHEGTLGTLKRFHDEVREVQAGQECGMGFESYQDLKQGDVIECFEVETIERSL
jgi:translation initiation factor IF-2